MKENASKPNPKSRSRIGVILAGFGVVMLLSLLSIGITMRRAPDWYQPATVAAAERQSVRNRLTDANLLFNARLVEGTPFNFEIECEQLTEWLAVREHIFLKADSWFPEFVRNPVVAADHGRLVLAGEFDKEGWRGIGSILLGVEVSDLSVTVYPRGFRLGSMPVPFMFLSNPIESTLKELRIADGSMAGRESLARIARGAPQDAAELFEHGWRTSNEFVYPDGEQPFKLEDCRFENGRIKLRIRPL